MEQTLLDGVQYAHSIVQYPQHVLQVTLKGKETQETRALTGHLQPATKPGKISLTPGHNLELPASGNCVIYVARLSYAALDHFLSSGSGVLCKLAVPQHVDVECPAVVFAVRSQILHMRSMSCVFNTRVCCGGVEQKRWTVCLLCPAVMAGQRQTLTELYTCYDLSNKSED